MKTYALIGAAGYIAPRHMRAIADTGGKLAAAYGPNNSVGVMDSHFPDAEFFTEFERFDRHVDKLRRRGTKIDYAAICSPNYLHDARCRFALRSGIDAICEKPLVLNPWNIDGLAEIERDTGRRISTILQLRLHPAIAALRERFSKQQATQGRIDLYNHPVADGITLHGRAMKQSPAAWRPISACISSTCSASYSGLRVAMRRSLREAERAAGSLECQRADVSWFLSIDRNDLPESVKGKKTTFRSITVDGEEVEFSEGFTDMHTRSYAEIFAGRGFGLEEVRPSIEIVPRFVPRRLSGATASTLLPEERSNDERDTRRFTIFPAS